MNSIEISDNTGPIHQIRGKSFERIGTELIADFL